MAGQGSSTKAILYALLANFGIACAKGAAAIYTGSGSMLAESIHSLADCTNQLLLFLGLKRAVKPPDEKHPLGYGKVIFFWSFIVAMLLFSMGGIFSIREGYHKLVHPEGLSNAWVALLVLGVSIVLESFSLAGALREIKLMRGEKPIRQWLKESRQVELIVIFWEDIAALVGLVVAFIFVLLAWVTGNVIFDAVGSIFIGVILVIISVFLFVRVKALLIGQAAEPDLQKHIHDVIAADVNIKAVYNVITMQLGPHVMLAAKIGLKSGISVEQACKVINVMESGIKAKFPQVKWSFIEPDVKD